MEQAKHTMDVTGAGSGVGLEFAKKFKDSRETVNMWLVGGRRADTLLEAAEQSNAAMFIPGDLFDPASEPHLMMMKSSSRVIVHAAAINLDTMEDKTQCDPLRIAQIEFLDQLVQAMMKCASGNQRLLIAVNSVTAYFARELPKAAAQPYMRMKMEQADILTAARAGLEAAGIRLCVVYPGAIRTDMMRHLPDDDKAVRMANMFGSRLKRVPGREAGLAQDRIFQPEEVASALAKLVNHFLVNGAIPESSKEWIMTNHADLVIPELEAIR